MNHASPPLGRNVILTVLAAALGYFVDAYDLVLYNIVRVRSLGAMGISGSALLEVGVDLLNLQLVGMLLGGILWGICGDKLGRRSVLFGSILTYSLATFANAWVSSVGAYGVCRFLSGLGLAGELGAGITLVSEILPPRIRGYGTMIVAAVGVVGVCIASLVGDFLQWRTSYAIGGLLGLSLLGLRFGVRESTLYEAAKSECVSRGNLWLLVSKPRRLLRYLAVIFVALPIWCAIAIFVTFAPELGRAMHVAPVPSAARAVLFYYLGLTLGDVTSGLLSQRFKSRRRVMLGFMALFAGCLLAFPAVGGRSLGLHYFAIFMLGFASGFWAIFITTSAELFGTNLRATVATSAPNLVRGFAVPLTWAFKTYASELGPLRMAMWLAFAVLAVAVVCVFSLEETYGKPLDFVES